MIELTYRDGVAVLRMADGKANAMSLEFCQLLTSRLEELQASPARAIVITGEGRIFSAGVDLIRLLEGGVPYIRRFLPCLCNTFATAFSCPKPVVAAINGHAIAGGCVLACAADRKVMAEHSGRIGVTELLVGVPFPAIAFEIMRSAAAPQHLADVIFGAATFAPADAVQRGLIDEIVDPAVLIEEALARANALAALPPAAFAFTKRQIRRPGLERTKVDTSTGEVENIWAAPETLSRIRDYVERTLRK